MSQPHQGHPAYGPPPAAAYDQPSGPPAPGYPPAYPQAAPAYPQVTPAYPQVATAYPQTPGYPQVATAYPQTSGYPPAAAASPQMPGHRPDETQTYAAPHAAPAPGSIAAAAPARSSSTLGVIALIAALAAFVVASTVGAVSGYNIGLGVGHEIGARLSTVASDLSLLAPVRGWVLIAEIAFWAGTVLGVWALAQAIVALVKNRGRGAAVAAVTIAALGPVAFGVAVLLLVSAGLGAGTPG